MICAVRQPDSNTFFYIKLTPTTSNQPAKNIFFLAISYSQLNKAKLISVYCQQQYRMTAR